MNELAAGVGQVAGLAYYYDALASSSNHRPLMVARPSSIARRRSLLRINLTVDQSVRREVLCTW